MWARAGVFVIQDVLTRSRESAAESVKFIGAGRATGALDEMRGADVWMIATRDDAIVPSCAALAASGKVTPDDIVFHVSGATPSTDLNAVKKQGALIASVHPIKTFSDAAQAVEVLLLEHLAHEAEALLGLELVVEAHDAGGVLAAVLDRQQTRQHVLQDVGPGRAEDRDEAAHVGRAV